jgi:hypothetical protein
VCIPVCCPCPPIQHFNQFMDCKKTSKLNLSVLLLISYVDNKNMAVAQMCEGGMTVEKLHLGRLWKKLLNCVKQIFWQLNTTRHLDILFLTFCFMARDMNY